MSAETGVDRTGAQRQRPMQMPGLGLGRMNSLRVALRMIGYIETYHGYACVHENPPGHLPWGWGDGSEVREEGKPWIRREWDALLGECMAVLDLPCMAFSQDLSERYPEVKASCYTQQRASTGGYQSSCNKLLALRNDWKRDAWGLINEEARITRKAFWSSFDYFFEGDFKKKTRRRYDEHDALIRRIVPKERLLEYNVTQGWGPLCDFLGKEVPVEDLPVGNDPQDSFRRFAAAADWRRRKESLWSIALWTTAALAVGVAISRRPAHQAMLSGLSEDSSASADLAQKYRCQLKGLMHLTRWSVREGVIKARQRVYGQHLHLSEIIRSCSLRSKQYQCTRRQRDGVAFRDTSITVTKR